MSREIHKVTTLNESLFNKVKEKVVVLTEEDWDIHPLRREKYEMHSYTDTIPLNWFDGNNEHKRLRSIFKKDLEDIRKVIATEYGSKKCSFFNVFLIRMKPHSSIPVHIDSIDYDTQDLAGLLRCHIPIVTHPGVTFTVGDVTEHLEEGNLYSIDNFLTPHGVINDSDVERIHMILDVRLQYGF